MVDVNDQIRKQNSVASYPENNKCNHDDELYNQELSIYRKTPKESDEIFEFLVKNCIILSHLNAPSPFSTNTREPMKFSNSSLAFTTLSLPTVNWTVCNELSPIWRHEKIKSFV